jgi:hypothetical protein
VGQQDEGDISRADGVGLKRVADPFNRAGATGVDKDRATAAQQIGVGDGQIEAL